MAPYIKTMTNTPMTTYEKIQDDIKDAMLDKNNVKRDCLRNVISEIKNRTVNAGKELSESICLDVLKKAVKQHNDSIESFKAGKREDLALKETKELSYIKTYLPKMYSEEMVQTVILGILSANSISEDKSSFGQVMKLLNMREDKDLIDKKYASQYLNVLLK